MEATMWKLLFGVLVVVSMRIQVSSVQFVFEAPSYTLEETYGKDNVNTTMVTIHRIGSINETNQEQTITLNTNCLPGITPTATQIPGDDWDFAVQNEVIFAEGELVKDIWVIIQTDLEDELMELFCLTIETDPGIESSTVIVIPGNDFCYDVNLAAAPSYEINNGRYVGPWFTDTSNVMEVWITPEGAGDINIFLATHADLSAPDFHYYGILLDDSAGGTHGGTNGQSVILYDGTFQDTLTPNDLIDHDNAPIKFWLKYEGSTGTISIGTENNRRHAAYSWQHGSANAKTVRHIFVSSVEAGKSAYIKLCHPASPRKIVPVDATSTGYQAGGVATRAVDGNRGPNFIDGNCFLSGDVDDPWLRIDLGREYDVKVILIWPVDDNVFNAGINRDSIANAAVYVGSCDASDIHDNIVCDNDVASTTGLKVVEVTCPAKTYGRYVYILQNAAVKTAFSLCEIEVYATEIPYGDETKVEFSQSLFDVDEGSATVSITANRKGKVLTCTSVDIYTDNSITPASGNTNDFTATSLLSPETLEWDSSDGATRTLSIAIGDDNVCEPYETFKVYLTNVIGGTIGAQSWATVGIIDDDNLTFSLESPVLTTSEGDYRVRFGVTRTGAGIMQPGSAELKLTDGTANSDDFFDYGPISVDFEASATTGSVEVVLLKDDEMYEPDETFFLFLGELTPPACSVAGQYSSTTVTIIDNDSQFMWNSDSSITLSEGEVKTIEITRNGTVQWKILSIEIDEWSANFDEDFSILPGSNGHVATVQFEEGNDTTSITVTVKDDYWFENNEKFTLTLRDPLYPNGNIAEPYRLQITILDNDAEYSWLPSSYVVRESIGPLEVCLVRRGDFTKAISVGISTDVIRDKLSVPASIDFAAGQPEACAKVQIIGDTTVQPIQVFGLNIANGQDIAVGANNEAVVYIIHGDGPTGTDQPLTSVVVGLAAGVGILLLTVLMVMAIIIIVLCRRAAKHAQYRLQHLGTSGLPYQRHDTSLRNGGYEEDQPVEMTSITPAVIGTENYNATTDREVEMPSETHAIILQEVDPATYQNI